MERKIFVTWQYRIFFFAQTLVKILNKIVNTGFCFVIPSLGLGAQGRKNNLTTFLWLIILVRERGRESERESKRGSKRGSVERERKRYDSLNFYIFMISLFFRLHDFQVIYHYFSDEKDSR